MSWSARPLLLTLLIACGGTVETPTSVDAGAGDAAAPAPSCLTCVKLGDPVCRAPELAWNGCTPCLCGPTGVHGSAEQPCNSCDITTKEEAPNGI